MIGTKYLERKISYYVNSIRDIIDEVFKWFDESSHQFNDALWRKESFERVTGILQPLKDNGGLCDYIIMVDERNNSQEIIDQGDKLITLAIRAVRLIAPFIITLKRDRNGKNSYVIH